jgi:hypothetical protein
MSGSPKFFFVHLQKTAGTSLLLRLRHHFSEEAIYPTNSEKSIYTSFSVDLLKERFAERGAEIEVATGHLPLGAADLLGEDFTVFTVLRHPLERTLSFLRQQQAQDPQYHDSPLDAVYDEPYRRGWLLTNHMVRMIGQNADEVATSTMVSDEEFLARSKEILSERVDCFGFQESFEEFCAELTRRYGWDLGEPIRANTTEPSEASPELIERILDDNRIDVEFYEFAQHLAATRGLGRPTR